MKNRALKCDRCQLSKTRTNVVWGSGDIRCPVKLIGEAPGADEDENGIPFVGRAGMYMTGVLIELTGNPHIRDTLFVSNTLLCRPPENRVPLPSELDACGIYLRYQLFHHRPKVIGCIGRTAGIRLIGESFEWNKFYQHYHNADTKYMVIYHPSFVLRNGRKGTPARMFREGLRLILKEGGLL